MAPLPGGKAAPGRYIPNGDLIQAVAVGGISVQPPLDSGGFNVNMPAGIQAGDLLVAMYSGTSANAPAGYATRVNAQFGVFTRTATATAADQVTYGAVLNNDRGRIHSVALFRGDGVFTFVDANDQQFLNPDATLFGYPAMPAGAFDDTIVIAGGGRFGGFSTQTPSPSLSSGTAFTRILNYHFEDWLDAGDDFDYLAMGSVFQSSATAIAAAASGWVLDQYEGNAVNTSSNCGAVRFRLA